ncbi:MAG: phosphoribosylamine--glycine ligase [Odoribacter sp.]|nr:phosphoribosylamine--glycine ligase [Odoribacter sp.]
MNILILGSGGREHAIAWKLVQSKKVSKIFIGPGNAGTESLGVNLTLDPEKFDEVKHAVLVNKIDIVIVGPEAPLVKGIHDFFLNDEQLSEVPVIGPVKAAALLEGSKDFAKEFMMRYNIPTAAYRTFDKTTQRNALHFMKKLKPPYVLKADGLAAGKGVVILDNLEEALVELSSMLNGKFGEAGNKVVIEQFLKGIELSVFVITDGHSYKILPAAKDYKRVGVGDTGLNTGGMGAVSPVSFAGKSFMEKVEERIIKPTIRGLSEEEIVYKGFIFFGLINVDNDPYVIEYNVRLGDPESEVIIPRIKSDFFELIEGVAKCDLHKREIHFDDRFVTTVMMVSGGYPGNFERGKVISGLDQTSDSVVFHAGTKTDGAKVLTNGGRVLAVSAWGDSMQEALKESYRNAGLLSFEGSYYRTDIGFDL